MSPTHLPYPKQCGNLGTHFVQFFNRRFPFWRSFAGAPVQVFDLVGQYRAADAFRTNDDLETDSL